MIIAPHGDADGLAAGALAIRAVERMGGTPIPCLPGKGEHAHTPAMRERLGALAADGLVVLDMGSRSGPIVRGLPTIVIDHHDPREVPDDATYVSSAGCEPVAPTGLLAYVAFLRGLGLGEVEGEFANGHPRATGGSLPPGEFARMLRALGYPDAAATSSDARARTD